MSSFALTGWSLFVTALICVVMFILGVVAIYEPEKAKDLLFGTCCLAFVQGAIMAFDVWFGGVYPSY